MSEYTTEPPVNILWAVFARILWDVTVKKRSASFYKAFDVRTTDGLKRKKEST